MPDTFAGFAPANIAEYFGVDQTAARGIIALGNGSTAVALPADEKAALAKLDINRFKPGASGPNQGFGDIAWGLDHLAQHPLGSHYHGDFSVTDLIANVATGGLYGVGKAGFNIVTGNENVVAGVKDAFASTGTGGSILQPTIGTNKSLIVEGAVAATAIAGPLAAVLGPAAAFIKDSATKAFTTYVAGENTNTVTPAESPLIPTGSPTYVYGGGVSPTGAGVAPVGSGGFFDSSGNAGAPSAPVSSSSPVVILSIVGLAVFALVILKRRN